MNPDTPADKKEPPRKPLWPWLLLLLLTLLTIYWYNWFSRMVDDVFINMPAAIVEFLDQLLGDPSWRERPAPERNLRIVIPAS